MPVLPVLPMLAVLTVLAMLTMLAVLPMLAVLTMLNGGKAARRHSVPIENYPTSSNRAVWLAFCQQWPIFRVNICEDLTLF